MPTMSMNNNNKNTSNNNPFTNVLIALFCMWVVLPMIMSAMTPMQESAEEVEEIVEETEDETIVDESAGDGKLFEVVKSRDSNCTVMYFKPTGIMYVSYHYGDLVQLNNNLGEPLTYDEYLRLSEK